MLEGVLDAGGGGRNGSFDSVHNSKNAWIVENAFGVQSIIICSITLRTNHIFITVAQYHSC